MVYFNCGQCGTGLRKNQIEQHKFQCKSRIFSCIDCNKDFRNDEYKSHIKCLTESERYESKSSFVSKQNKGELKQNAWFEKVLKAVESFKGSPKAKSLLEKLTDYPNVPRKKAKFFNFVRNSFRSYHINDSQIEEIWIVIESFDKAEKNQQKQQQQKPHQQNGNLKRKLDVNESEQEQIENDVKKEENINDELNNDGEFVTFDWTEIIKKECSKQENNQINLNKLEKKVFKKYKKFKTLDKNDSEQDQDLFDKFKKKFNKKLKKLDQFDLIDQDDNSILVKCKN